MIARARWPTALALGLLLAVGAPAAGAGPVEPAGVYVALGDSFAAGPLIPNQIDIAGCIRSDHNYPHLVAAALEAPLRDATCSGATTDDMTAPQNVSGGPNPPQFDALGADTTTVTINIGGDDIGYLDIVISCITGDAAGTPCQDRYVVGGVDEISNRIAATAPKVATVLQGIRDRAPAAQIFLVGYLQILPDTGGGCRDRLPFADADVPYLQAKQRELEAMLAAQAAANGAAFVDAFAASAGHDACQPVGVRWVEPLVGAASGAPVHPNALGMECTAVLVLGQLAPGAGAAGGLCRPPAQPVQSTPVFTG
ncbi:MAG: SGNH/GDSL hydrolase family protein [Acidimicrobiia bacterium]